MIRHVACLLLAMATVTTGSAQTPSFSSHVESVRIDVLVTQNEKSVRGLGPADFEVRDNGVLQTVDLVSDEGIPLNVILALDMSASVDAERLEHLRVAGKALLGGLRETDRAALVTFSHLVSQASPLTSDVRRLQTALDEASASGQTNLVDATFLAMMIGESDVGRSLLIVFSDGVDSTSWLDANAVLDTARRSDVVIYSAEVGTRQSDFLRDVSAATGGRAIELESAKDLRSTFRSILEEFRQRYLISYSPRGVSPGGWHRLDVRVKGRNTIVRARPGYLAGSRE